MIGKIQLVLVKLAENIAKTAVAKEKFAVSNVAKNIDGKIIIFGKKAQIDTFTREKEMLKEMRSIHEENLRKFPLQKVTEKTEKI
jgi:hypothetical protein